MFNRIICAIFYCIPASCMTYLCIRWWIELGMERPYPYIATAGAVLLWLLVYGAYTDKEK